MTKSMLVDLITLLLIQMAKSHLTCTVRNSDLQWEKIRQERLGWLLIN